MFATTLPRAVARMMAMAALSFSMFGFSAEAEEVGLRSLQSGRYVTAESGYLAASAVSPAAAGRWDMVRLDGNRVAFRVPRSGTFVRAGVGKGTFLAEGSPHIRGWETFELIRLDGGRVALRSVLNGKYVRAGVGRGSLLAAVSDRVAGWETFELVTIGVHRPGATILGEWRLVQVAYPGARLRPVSEAVSRRAYMRFDDRGRLSGRGGCNSFHTSYHRKGDRLVIGQLTTTKMLCRGEAGTVEENLYAGLPMATSFTASHGGARVTLLDRFATPLAVLERR